MAVPAISTKIIRWSHRCRIRFVADRAAKDLRLPLRLAQCDTPVQALGVAAAHAFETARDYVAETEKLIELTAGDFESAAAAVI